MKKFAPIFCVLMLLPLGGTPVALADTNDTPLDIKPAAGVDENLFLMRALEFTYERWPRNTDRAYLQTWIAQARSQTSRLRATIRERNLDPAIGKLYDDCLHLLDAYENCLANLGAIDRVAAQRAQDDSGKVVETFFKSGFRAADEAKGNGASDKQATGVGIGLGIFDAFMEDDRRSQTRDAAKREAENAEMRKVSAAWTETKSNAEIAAERLTKVHGWQPGEAGFDGFTSKQMDDYLKRRPRDPFVRVAFAHIRDEAETPVNVLGDARSCLEAARQVPDGRAYDQFRKAFVTAAADLAVMAASRELDNFTYSSGPANSAPEAVRICKTLLSVDPADESGEGNMRLARALGCAGRYADAINAANKAKPFYHDANFAFRYARLMSLTGSTKASLEWFEYAVKQGFNNLSMARNDPDLKSMREKHATAFAEFVRVQYEWRIKYGDFFSDDIIVTNKSLFPLTNVTLTPTITKNGSTYTKSLTVPYLAVGGSFTWKDVFSIPDSKADSATATLSSDQTK